MVNEYLKVALRVISKNKLYSAINLFGLSAGVAACMLITLYVVNELSYDTYNENYDRIYRIGTQIKYGSTNSDWCFTPAPLAGTLLRDYPEVEAAVRFNTQGTYLVRRGDRDKFRERHITFADSSIFSVFTLPFIYGNPHHALREPNSVVISQTIAAKYFPGENPLGQDLTFFDKWNVKVTGVMEDMPPNSHFHMNFIISMAGLDESRDVSWLSVNFRTYLLLRQGADASALQAKFPGMIENYAGQEFVNVINETYDQFIHAGNAYGFSLTPLKDIHLYSNKEGEWEPNGDIAYVYLFSAIALFILVLACINFINMSTARSSTRAREVAVRKILGSLRAQLMKQFIFESVLFSLAGFGLGLTIAYAILPSFNDLVARQLIIPFGSATVTAVLIVSAIIIGILAGIYPSFFLSSFKPISIINGLMHWRAGGGGLRRALVVFQFVISILLMIGTVSIFRQMRFIQNIRIGFDRNHVIIIDECYALGRNVEAFKNAVLQDNRISSGTVSGFLPVSGYNRNSSSYWPEGTQPTGESLVGAQNWTVDVDYIPTLGIKLVAGRNFSANRPADSSAVILNASAAKALGIGPLDLEKKQMMGFAFNDDGTVDKTKIEMHPVIGIVEDFHYESLRQKITPVVFFLGNDPANISFRYNADDTQAIISHLQSVWGRFLPDLPLSYSFMDEDFSRMYVSENRTGTIFSIFTGLAVLIGCLGLFALTAFSAEQRTREIGIRKVLGASVPAIVLLLGREYMKLILISFILVGPIAWYGTQWWLQQYAYKVDIGPAVYGLAGLSSLGIACLTMSFQSIKAATANPVDSLRRD